MIKKCKKCRSGKSASTLETSSENQTSHQLSFVEREPHCLWLVVPRSLVIYSTIGSRPTFMEGIDSLRQDTPLCLLLWNCPKMQANWALVQEDGRTTGGALGGERALFVCIYFLMMWMPFHVEWSFPKPPGSSWTVSGLESVSFGHQCKNGAWLPRRPMSVVQRNTSQTILQFYNIKFYIPPSKWESQSAQCSL